jgi:hypothetical protein
MRWCFLLLLLQDEPYAKLFAWEQKHAAAQHQAIQDVGRWVFTDEALKRFDTPQPRELVKATVDNDVLRLEEKSGTREFHLEFHDGKVAAIEEGDLRWPHVCLAKPAAMSEKEVDRSDPLKAAKSFIRLRGELCRRLQEPLAELGKLMPLPDVPEPVVLTKDVDRRFAIVYVAHPLRVTPDGIEWWTVRLRMKLTPDGWRIEEEGVYCPDCPEHAKCKSCSGRGVMTIGENEKALCIGCRPDGACKTCGGRGYRTRFSLLTN